MIAALVTLAILAVAAAVFSSLLWRETRALRAALQRQEKILAALTARVYRLETGATPAAASPSVPTKTTKPVEPPVTPTEKLPEAEPDRSREDWETVVGANWLNRLGALVLVIGLALFPGYSLTRLGPAGRVAVGVAVGASLLAIGVVLERRWAYRSFSFSLMGAGWAVIYFTAYAAHALEPARIISNPVAGLAVLLAVSAGMVLHSLRYRSENATALAFLFGFVALNVSPLTGFSVAASLLLGLGLIGLAYRFNWRRLPLAGVLLTYLTFILRYDASVYGEAGLLTGQYTLWIYWLVFESFDLLDTRRRGAGTGIDRSLFALNTTGFIGASVLHGWAMRSDQWAVFLGLASIAYLASACLRRRLVQTSTPGIDGFEAASTASAALMAGSLIARFEGLSITIALMTEGQMIAFTGLALRSRYVERLGGAVLGVALFRLLAVDMTEPNRGWPLTAAVLATVFALNRRLLEWTWYGSGASALLIGAVLAEELPRAAVAPVWALGGVASLAAGAYFKETDLKWLALPIAIAAFCRASIYNVNDGAIVSSVIVVACFYASRWILPPYSLLGTVLLTLLLFHEVQGRLLTVACGIEGFCLIAAGFLLADRLLRISGLSLFLLCVAKLFIYDFREIDALGRILSFVTLGVMLLGASWVYTRFRDKLRRFL